MPRIVPVRELPLKPRVLGAEGGNPVKILEDAWFYNLTWLPDSRRIVYNNEGPEQIRLAYLNGNEPFTITSGDYTYKYSYDLSPDGKSVAYSGIQYEKGDRWIINISKFLP